MLRDDVQVDVNKLTTSAKATVPYWCPTKLYFENHVNQSADESEEEIHL